jgi:hypothetical protein
MFIDGLVTSCILFNSVSHASVEAGPGWFDTSETLGQSHNTIASEPNATYVRFKLSIASVFATADNVLFALFLGAGRMGFRKNNKCEVRC